MADQKIIEYIRMNLDKGYNSQILKKQLLKQGWTETEIDEAFVEEKIQDVAPPAPPVPAGYEEAKKSEKAQKPSEPRKQGSGSKWKRKKVIIPVIIIIVVLALVALYYFDIVDFSPIFNLLQMPAA